MKTIKKKLIENQSKNNPQVIISEIWEMLKIAINDRHADFRCPIFLTSVNNQPDGRAVVLREANSETLNLKFNADIRSNKINILKNNPQAALIFYDKKKKIQLRIKVNCSINYKNEISKQAWQKTQQISRKCYLASLAPGTTLEQPGSSIDNKFETFDYSFEESEMGEDNFCVINCNIITIEWLYLSAKGHRRAKIDFNKQGNHFNWLVP